MNLKNQLGGLKIKSYTDGENKINIVIKDWFFWAGAELIKEDLSLADLLICYTRELVTGPWENYYKECLKSLNNPNFIVVASGKLNPLFTNSRLAMSNSLVT